MEKSLKNFFKNKKILIAGGTGLIGAHLVNKLISYGANVVAASIDSKIRAQKVLSKPTIYKFCDFRDSYQCSKITKNIDILVNLMGVRESTQLGTSRSATALSAFLICNTNLLDNACKNKIKNYLFCGSINQYPPIKIRNEDSVWNGLPSQQDKYVGLAKRIGEIQADAYSKQFDWNVVKIIRPSNVYGPYDNFNPTTAHVIPSLIHKACRLKKNGILNIAGDGSAIRDFIYVEDCVQGIIKVLISKHVNTPFNIGSGVGTSIKKVVEIILEHFKYKNLKVKWNKNLPTGDDVRILDIKRAKKYLKFKCNHDLNEGIKKTVDWYVKNEIVGFKLGRTYDKKY
jgi:GDP-L-fucose synthase